MCSSGDTIGLFFWSWTTCFWRNRRLLWLELMPPWCCCEYHRIRYGFRWPFCGPQEGCVWLLNGSAMVLREYCNFVNNYVKLIIFCFCSDPGLCTCCFVLWPTPGFVSAETSADDLCYCLWLWSVLLWVLVILCLRLEGSTPIPVLSRFLRIFRIWRYGFVWTLVDGR